MYVSGSEAVTILASGRTRSDCLAVNYLAMGIVGVLGMAISARSIG